MQYFSMPALKTDGLAAGVYQRVRASLVEGHFEPGQALFEVKLAAEMGVSRTPVREALRVLASDGFLEIVPSRGYIVPRHSVNDARELFELRESLEGMASRYAALRATPAEIASLEHLCIRYEHETDWRQWAQVGSEFHSLLVSAARNARLKTILDSLKEQIIQLRRSLLRDDDARRDIAIREHRLILDCVKARDEIGAEARAREHVRHSHRAAMSASQVPPVIGAQ